MEERCRKQLKTFRRDPVGHRAHPGESRDRGLPALMRTDTSFLCNPHVHRATDTRETLGYPFLARVTAGVCQTLALLLQAGA